MLVENSLSCVAVSKAIASLDDEDCEFEVPDSIQNSGKYKCWKNLRTADRPAFVEWSARY
jgi:hypothetical protein